VKITGPQLDINIDADIVTGECRVGDESGKIRHFAKQGCARQPRWCIFG